MMPARTKRLGSSALEPQDWLVVPLRFTTTYYAERERYKSLNETLTLLALSYCVLSYV